MDKRKYRVVREGLMVRADVAAMLDSEENLNIQRALLSMPQDILEGMVDRGESADSLFVVSYLLESGLETAERLRLRIKDREEGPMAKDKVSDVDPESVFNPFIPNVTDDEIIRAGQARDYLEKYGPKLDPPKAPEPAEDLEDPKNNEFIPE